MELSGVDCGAGRVEFFEAGVTQRAQLLSGAHFWLCKKVLSNVSVNVVEMAMLAWRIDVRLGQNKHIQEDDEEERVK